MTKYIERYLKEVSKISSSIDIMKIENVINKLIQIKFNKGRLFFLGVGGSAANCTHAVNDFRKIAQIESYSPLDNVAELTARINDEGWEGVFKDWLIRSNLNSNDALFILSVGGGDKIKNISTNLITAIDYAKEKNSTVIGLVGRDGGYTGKNSDYVVTIPTISNDTITPHAESWQAVIWHLIVTDPRIQSFSNKWENIDNTNDK